MEKESYGSGMGVGLGLGSSLGNLSRHGYDSSFSQGGFDYRSLRTESSRGSFGYSSNPPQISSVPQQRGNCNGNCSPCRGFCKS
jgi:hypothetical protein